jgi:hypothetical protein
MSYALQKVKPKHQKVNLLLIIKLRKKNESSNFLPCNFQNVHYGIHVEQNI